MSGRLGYLWRIFKRHQPTPESLPFEKQGFTMPDDPLTLHPAAKRVVTICNLYANQNKSVEEIAGLLETKTSLVISGLIKGGVITDRRQSNQRVKHDRRTTPKYHLPLTWQTGRVDYSTALCGLECVETVSEFIFREVAKSEERCAACSAQQDQREHGAVSASGLEESYRY
jgi:hypothetical protein